MSETVELKAYEPVDERDARMCLSWILPGVDPDTRVEVQNRVFDDGASRVWEELRIHRLLGYDPDPLAEREGWNRLARLCDSPAVFEDMHRHIDDHMVAHHSRFVVPGDPEWPTQLNDLRGVEDGGVPVGLWVEGGLSLAGATAGSVAIVGLHDPTRYGYEIAESMGRDVAASGTTVVAGDEPIDLQAHVGAWSAWDGRTVCVQATKLDDLDVNAPPGLFKRIASDGLLVSEVPPDCPYGTLTPSTFRERNRIVAALTSGTVIVSGQWRSAAILKVTYAEDLNRRLMAVPGPVTEHWGAGTNRLLVDGRAVAVTSGSDVVKVLSPDNPRPVNGTVDPVTQLRDLLRTLSSADVTAAIDGVASEVQGALWQGLHNQGWIGTPTSIADLRDRVFNLLDTEQSDSCYTRRVMATVGQTMWEQAVTLTDRSWAGYETELSNIVETCVAGWLQGCPWSSAIVRDETQDVLRLIDEITTEGHFDPPVKAYFDELQEHMSDAVHQLPPDAVLAVANYPYHDATTWQLLGDAAEADMIAKVTPILLTSEPWHPYTLFRDPPADYVPTTIDLNLSIDDASSLAKLLVEARQQLFIPESRAADEQSDMIGSMTQLMYIDVSTQVADAIREQLSDYPPEPITTAPWWATDDRPYSNPEASEREYLWDLSRGLDPPNPWATQIDNEPDINEQDWRSL